MSENMKCKHCQTRPAEAPAMSAFLLCEGCAGELYPGASVEKYMELRNKYGR